MTEAVGGCAELVGMESCFMLYQRGPWFLFFVAVEHLGKTELAISNITRSVSAVFFVIVNSFAVTTGSLVSNAIGAGERRLFSLSAVRY